jgi:flagellar hook-basal body complex protein FliE
MLSGIGSNLTSIFPELTNVSAGQSSSAAAGQSGSFSDALKSAVQGVDDLQGSADMQVTDLLHGAPNADVNRAMVSVEKADVAFQLMMQVRNKIVSAYQDIEKMQF